jgi:hypothetical protein
MFRKLALFPPTSQQLSLAILRQLLIVLVVYTQCSLLESKPSCFEALAFTLTTWAAVEWHVNPVV